MKKQFFAIAMAVVVALAVMVCASAASGISADEQALLDKFSAGVTADDGSAVVTPATYIANAEEWLAKEDCSAEDLAILNKAVDDIFAIMKANNIHSAKEAQDSAVYADIVSIAQTAADKVGFDIWPGDPSTYGADIVKQTGAAEIATVVVVSLLAVALIATLVVVGKKNLLAARA